MRLLLGHYGPVSRDVSNNDGADRVRKCTTDGIILVDAGTTEGYPIIDLAGSEKPNHPLVNRSSVLFTTGLFHKIHYSFYVFCALGKT